MTTYRIRTKLQLHKILIVEDTRTKIKYLCNCHSVEGYSALQEGDLISIVHDQNLPAINAAMIVVSSPTAAEAQAAHG